MTLIFSFTRHGLPLLGGDTLLTRSGAKEEVERLPGVGRVNPAIAEDFSIVVAALRQKVNIIHEHVALAWSGSYSRAESLALDVRSHVREHGVSRTGIARIVHAHSDSNLRCIALIAEGQQTSIAFGGVDRANLRRFENVLVAGSGAQYFKETLAAIDSVDPVTDLPEGNFVRAIADALTIASQAIGRDLYHQLNIRNRWGGALELCYRNASGAFEKVDRIAFTHFVYDEERPEEGLKWTNRLLLNRYNGEFLECLGIECQKQPDSELLRIAADDSAVIPPLLGGAVPAAPLPRCFDYDYLCTHFSYRRAGKPIWSTSHIDASPGRLGPLIVDLHDSEVEVKFTRRLGDRMRSEIARFQSE